MVAVVLVVFVSVQKVPNNQIFFIKVNACKAASECILMIWSVAEVPKIQHIVRTSRELADYLKGSISFSNHCFQFWK